VGSNADLPIVGGSILSHEHFQGGHFTFPMEKAPVERTVQFAGYEDIRAGIVKWPLSVIRLTGASRERLADVADRILRIWRTYSDPDAFILAETDGVPHNTITPIARKTNDGYRLSLVLRNNRTSEEHPLGIFHPHAELHHIKKENIGLIEVMGLFILPGRLLAEFEGLRDYLTGRRPIDDAPAPGDPLEKHYEWVKDIASRVGTSLTDAGADAALRRELGAKCARVLADAGVYKHTPQGDQGLLRFLNTLGYTRQ
jgi:UDPglucose--hexose-1-phosphate uridylyltransferase